MWSTRPSILSTANCQLCPSVTTIITANFATASCPASCRPAWTRIPTQSQSRPSRIQQSCKNCKTNVTTCYLVLYGTLIRCPLPDKQNVTRLVPGLLSLAKRAPHGRVGVARGSQWERESSQVGVWSHSSTPAAAPCHYLATATGHRVNRGNSGWCRG